MPNYQIYYATSGGELNRTCDIEESDTLDSVLPDMLVELEEDGHVLEGRQEGGEEVYVIWQGRHLDKTRPLPQQGVRPNDVLRVMIQAEAIPLQLRRDNELFDVHKREELREGDVIIIGRTILRFHLRNQQKALSMNTTIFQRIQERRSLKQTVYFMTLVGGIAGLGCWFVVSLIQDYLISDIINMTILGGFIGGLTVGFNDHWLGDRVVLRWVLMGILIGTLAGFAGGLIQSLIDTALGEKFPLLSRTLSWTIVGSLIGFSISVRWLSINKRRVLHGLIGGMVGGLFGGLAFWVLKTSLADISQALGFILTGMGITCGISLAPILLRQGMIEFVNSGDRAVLEKYSQSGKQWEIHDGGRYIIGSLSAGSTRTAFTPEVNIFIPDEMVEQRHALLISKARKYFIEPHAELVRSIRPAPAKSRT
jgi:hypothetical protein